MDTFKLGASRDEVRKTAGDNAIVLAHATAVRMVGAWTLAPAPRDPARHVEAAHAQARGHLARLTGHDPAREVTSVMTEELFTRLTSIRSDGTTRHAGGSTTRCGRSPVVRPTSPSSTRVSTECCKRRTR